MHTIVLHPTTTAQRQLMMLQVQVRNKLMVQEHKKLMLRPVMSAVMQEEQLVIRYLSSR